jgi:hypothetical protein
MLVRGAAFALTAPASLAIFDGDTPCLIAREQIGGDSTTRLVIGGGEN